MIGFRDKANRSEVGEFLRGKRWGVHLDYPARTKFFGTTRLVDDDVPKSGEDYRWDIDDSYDATVQKIFGPRVASEISLGASQEDRPLLARTGKYAVHFTLMVYDRHRVVTNSDLEGLRRVDAFFDRMGYPTLGEVQATDLAARADQAQA